MRPGTVVGGRFEIECRAGVGATSEVHRARDLATGALVACKALGLMDEASIARLMRERALMQSLDHPAIARAMDGGVTPEGVPYLIIEWVEGPPLRARLHDEGLTAAESVQLATRLADALGTAHANGVVHRDVKPSNILLRDGDPAQATLIDFGIARSVREQIKLTQTGTVLGSPGYLAPEQARGSTSIGPPADVFALGCVLYECLTGRRAFSGRDVTAVLTKILLAQPQPIEELDPTLPDSLGQLLDRMLAKDPVGRPADGSVVAAALRAVRLRDGGRRQPARGDETVPPTVSETEVAGRYLIFAAPDARASTEVQAEETALRRCIDAPGDVLEILADGCVVVLLRAGTSARRAGECALALRGVLPDAVMLVSGDAGDVGIDRGAITLRDDVLQRLFAATVGKTSPPGSIRLDRTAAERMDREFALVAIDEQRFLVPERVRR